MNMEVTVMYRDITLTFASETGQSISLSMNLLGCESQYGSKAYGIQMNSQARNFFKEDFALHTLCATIQTLKFADRIYLSQDNDPTFQNSIKLTPCTTIFDLKKAINTFLQQ